MNCFYQFTTNGAQRMKALKDFEPNGNKDLYVCTSDHACACTRAPTPHTYPETYAYDIYQCHPKTPPQITLPTDSVARFRKKYGMLVDGNSIDTEDNLKLADAHEGARPPEQKNTGANATQNCANADVDKRIWIETPVSCIPFPVC